MLSKYNFLFVFPLIMYLFFKNNKFDIKKTFVDYIKYFSIVVLVGLPWYIRNVLYLGNPIYHFLNPLFKKLGFSPYMFAKTVGRASIDNLFQVSHLQKAFFDLFGVPLGLVSNLKHINLPFMPLPLIIWGGVILLFFGIVVYSFFVKKDRELNHFSYLYLIPFLAMIILYLYDFGDLFLRLFLPAIPILGLFFALAVDKLLKTKIKYALVIFLVGCFLMFSLTELYKVNVASSEQSKLQEDYQWFKENVPSEAVIMPSNIELVYNLGVMGPGSEDDLIYYWDDGNRNVVDVNISSLDLVYENDKTNVRIYS